MGGRAGSSARAVTVSAASSVSLAAYNPQALVAVVDVPGNGQPHTLEVQHSSHRVSFAALVAA